LASNNFQKVKLALLPRLGGLPKQIYKKRLNRIFNTGLEGVDFTKHPAYAAADIVHLHWINGLVAMRTLRKVTKPIVWTLRDMWPLTGGCHYSIDCDRYRNGCGACPQLGSTSKVDLSSVVVKNKRSSLPSSMQIVGISNWLANCARDSAVFRHFDIRVIPNNIDCDDFFPVDQKTARAVLGLPVDRKLILIGAQNITDFYKGFDLLRESFAKLTIADCEIVVFGRASPEISGYWQFPARLLGFFSDSVSLRLAYSAADVFVAPSRMDAFGKTLAESMACGTPVVCFDATGPADVVEHMRTGYKAKPFEADSLARGIEWVLSLDHSAATKLREASRSRAVSCFDSKVIAAQYLDLYRQLVPERK
jgi:glycosyltransferase involved in cell wall biosynthesis